MSAIGHKNVPIATQEISLIGYGDSFSNWLFYKYFEVNEKDKSAQCAVDKLMNHIVMRHKVLKSTKQELLQPLFNFIKRYKEAHNAFWVQEFNDKPEIDMDKIMTQSFENGLIGTFYKHLKKIKD